MKIHDAHFHAGSATAVSFALLQYLAPSSAMGQSLVPFTEEAIARGLSYEIQPWQGSQQFQGFGMVIVDLDNDGDQDIVVMGREDGQVGFFDNNGQGVFTDRSSIDQQGNFINPVVLSKPSGIAAADYNGDGLIDLFISQETYEPDVLLRNDGSFRFTDVSVAAGVDNPGNGEAAVWGDYNNDGWLDLYLANYTVPIDQNNPLLRNQLYRNLGNGTFQSVGASLGVDDHGTTFATVWSDVDRNGTLDLYSVNDRGHLYTPNKLWRNDGGTFTSLCAQSGACIGLWAMGVGTGDFDGNGYPDFYMTNMPAASGYGGINSLLLNNGNTFSEASQTWQVHHQIFSWAAIFFDYNNDRWLDLYVCNQSEANRLYQNPGAPPALNVTAACAVEGSAGLSFNAAVGDVDGDGDLDLLLNNYGVNVPANVQLYINNDGASSNRWARFNVIGTSLSNRHAIGANIDLRTGEQWQWRELYAGGNNFKAQNETVFHFGLGSANIVDEIVVRWPGGSPTRTLTNYSVNKRWTIYPPSALGDSDGNNIINVADMLAVINAWGPVQPGKELCDTDGNGVVNVADLLFLINNWG